MNKSQCLILVDPAFKRKLKIESANLGMSMVKYTSMLSRKDMLELEKTDHYDKKRKRDMFDFGF